MRKLSLDEFKVKIHQNQINELESLTGGILGTCHCAEIPEHILKEWLKDN